MLSRHKARMQAFYIVFEHCFHDAPLPQLMEAASIARELEPDEFVEELAGGVLDKIEELDEIIDRYSVDWKSSRISRVSLSILRISLYELKYMRESVPVGVSINEAVAMAKKFATEEDASFTNGILGSFVRAEGLAE